MERTVSFLESPAKWLRIAFKPSVAGTAAHVTVPLRGDDLDAAGAMLPPGMHVAMFQRTG